MSEGETTPPKGRGRGRIIAFLLAAVVMGGYVAFKVGVFSPGAAPEPSRQDQSSGTEGASGKGQAALTAREDAAAPDTVSRPGEEPAAPAVAATGAPSEDASADTGPASAKAPVPETTSTDATSKASDAAASSPEPPTIEAAASEGQQARQTAATETAGTGAEPTPAAASQPPGESATPGATASSSVASPGEDTAREAAGTAPLDSPDAGTPGAPGTPPVPEVVASLPETTPARPGAATDLQLGTGDDARPALAPAPESTPPETDGAATDLPSFDVIRIDRTGSGIVAGRAAPGTTVAVMAGDLELATAEADSSGQFVAFITTPDSDEGQVLSLIARSGEEAARGVEDVLILPPLDDDTAAEGPTIVKAAEDEVRVMQPSSLGKVDGVTLDSISYDKSGAVKLAGRAPGAQTIRIYVDGEPAGAVESTEAGTWDATLPGIEEGRYILRVDALRPDGSVASRAESPFQRVYPTAAQLHASQITVQPGNTLWVMARDRYGKGILYTQIFAANKDAIRDPDLIYPGQIFTLPSEEEFER